MKKLLKPALLCCLLAATAALGDSLAHPDWHPDGNSLVLESDCFGIANITLLELATGTLTRLWAGKGIESYPRWFMNGQRIVFHQMTLDRRKSSLYFIDVKDRKTLTRVFQLTQGPFDIEPAPSPDGTKIAFTLDGENGLDIAIVDLATPHYKQIFTSNELEHLPTWSADGKSLVYHHQTRTGKAQIVRLQLDTGKRELLTSLKDSPSITAHIDPQRNRLVFASERAGDWELYLMDLASGKSNRLTFRPGRDGYPRFAPMGKRIAFHRQYKDKRSSIIVMDLATYSEVEYTCAGRKKEDS